MRGKLKNNDGAGLVEFALIALLLFTVLFGIIETGFLLYNQQIITNAGREGARFGIVARPDEPNGLYKNDTSDIINHVQNYADNYIVSFGSKNLTVTPSFEFSSSSGKDYCTEFQEELTVDVTYDYTFLFLPFATKTLGTKAVMLCE
jgi:Flp pilus assembly protein TadG